MSRDLIPKGRSKSKKKLLKEVPRPPPIYAEHGEAALTECQICTGSGKIGTTKCERCEGLGQRESPEPRTLYLRRMYNAAIAHQLQGNVVQALVDAEKTTGGYSIDQLKQLRSVAQTSKSRLAGKG